MTISIRRAAATDVPALVALMTVFYAESAFPLPEANAVRAFHALLADPRLGAIWIAEMHGRAVGHVVLTVSFSMEYGGLRGFIDDLFVHPDARRNGIAGALLAAVRAECVARGVRALLVETSTDNTPAMAAYTQAGYVNSGHALLSLPLAPPVHEA
jgi:GNAT superfamily N-acetyltransferase